MSENQQETSRWEQQEVWRRRLLDAENRYHQAMQQCAAVAKLGIEDVELQAAEKRRVAAREEYHRMLRIFSDFVVRGKRPKG